MAKRNEHCMLDVYYSLESLSLVVDQQFYRGEPEREPKWISLYMPDLMDLSVTQKDWDAGSFKSPFIFQHWSCPHLSRLSLDSLCIAEEGFLWIIKMHSLQSFTMGTLILDGPNCVSPLDLIRNCVQRPQHISLIRPLIVEDGISHWYELENKVDRLVEKVKSYLNFGGVNLLPR